MRQDAGSDSPAGWRGVINGSALWAGRYLQQGATGGLVVDGEDALNTGAGLLASRSMVRVGVRSGRHWGLCPLVLGPSTSTSPFRTPPSGNNLRTQTIIRGSIRSATPAVISRMSPFASWSNARICSLWPTEVQLCSGSGYSNLSHAAT